MGKEISYCHSCGHRLDRAFVHDGRRYCESCRPAEAVLDVPIATRRQTSTRLRQQPPAPRARETTRIRKRNPLPLTLSAAGLLALGVGIAIAAGHAPTPTPAAPPVVAAPAAETAAPKPPPPPSIEQTLARIKEMRESDLLFERRSEVLNLLKELTARAGPRLEEVDQVAAEYDRKFEQAAARLADFTRSEALRMASKQKFSEAIDRLNGYPETFRGSKSAESLRALRRELEQKRAEAARPASGESPRRVL